MVKLLQSVGMQTGKATKSGSAVRHPVFLDVVAVGLEQHVGAAMLADRLGGPLDHAVTFAGLLVLHLAGCGDLEALFGARFGLQLGHLALLAARSADKPQRPKNAFNHKGLVGCSGLSWIVASAALCFRAT